MIIRGGLEAGLLAVRAGEITFDAFVRQTSGRWDQIAHLLHQRWDVPLWYSVEDIRQDLLLAAWYFAWRYGDERSRHGVAWRRKKSQWRKKKKQKQGPLERFSVWNGLHDAQKKATKARLGVRPHRGEGKDVPSRYEKPISTLVRRDTGEDVDLDVAAMVSVSASQERIVECKLAFERAAKKARGPKRITFAAIVARGGDLADAAEALYENEDARWMLNLCCAEDAMAAVLDAVEDAAVVA